MMIPSVNDNPLLQQYPKVEQLPTLFHQKDQNKPWNSSINFNKLQFESLSRVNYKVSLTVSVEHIFVTS